MYWGPNKGTMERIWGVQLVPIFKKLKLLNEKPDLIRFLSHKKILNKILLRTAIQFPFHTLNKVLWFESEMSPIGFRVWTLGLQLVALFGKVAELLGG